MTSSSLAYIFKGPVSKIRSHSQVPGGRELGGDTIQSIMGCEGTVLGGSGWEAAGATPPGQPVPWVSHVSQSQTAGLGVELGVQPTLEKVLCWLSLSLEPSEEAQGSQTCGLW